MGGYTIDSCYDLTERQLWGTYIESLKLEARDSMRLFSLMRSADPRIDAAELWEDLNARAYPVDKEEAEEIGLNGFLELQAMIEGGGSMFDDVGKIAR